MTDDRPDSVAHRERILALYGLPVRRVTVDDDNMLTIEFGSTDRTAVFTTIGSVWRRETADRMIVASGDDHDTAVAAMADLVGRKLTKIRTQRPSTTVWLAFDDDSNLLAFPVTSGARSTGRWSIPTAGCSPPVQEPTPAGIRRELDQLAQVAWHPWWHRNPGHGPMGPGVRRLKL